MELDVDGLYTVFRRIWCPETSACPNLWSRENPAMGQCLATSRIVCEYLGGCIFQVHTVPGNYLHMFNMLPDGSEVDFTFSQFTFFPVKFSKTRIVMTPGELDFLGKGFPEVNRRYEHLKRKFEEEIGVLTS